MIAPAVEMSSLALFQRDVRRIPPLDREEEARLARRWRSGGDREAARRLVCGNLRAVARIAGEYRHFNLPEMDLIQEGTLGLMHAVKRFDPDRGYRLITYAAWWIRAAIHDFILRSWSIVKLGTTKVQRRVFAGLARAREAIAALEGRDADEVGAEYGISGDAYRELAGAYLQRDLSIDAGDGEGEPLVAALPAPEATPEEQVAEREWRGHRRLRLQEAMRELPDRDRYVLTQRRLTETPVTLRELADELGVSIERVRQLERRGMERLRRLVGDGQE